MQAYTLLSHTPLHIVQGSHYAPAAEPTASPPLGSCRGFKEPLLLSCHLLTNRSWSVILKCAGKYSHLLLSVCMHLYAVQICSVYKLRVLGG